MKKQNCEKFKSKLVPIYSLGEKIESDFAKSGSIQIDDRKKIKALIEQFWKMFEEDSWGQTKKIQASIDSLQEKHPFIPKEELIIQVKIIDADKKTIVLRVKEVVPLIGDDWSDVLICFTNALRLNPLPNLKRM